MLYNKLLKFREDQLENYQGPPIEYSVSDYHHAPRQALQRPLSPSSSQSSLEGRSSNQCVSQYSILKENVRPQKSKSYKRQTSIAETVASYDPYRTSRNKIAKTEPDHARITVLRGINGSYKSQTSRTSFSRRVMSKPSVPNPALLRISRSGVYSISSSPPVAYNPGARQVNASINQRRIPPCATRRSLSSNVAARSSTSYKRGVSFAHMTKRSVTTQHPSVVMPKESSPLNVKRDYLHDRHDQTSSSPQSAIQLDSPQSAVQLDSPQSTASSVIHLPKNNGKSDEEKATRHLKTASHYWKEDARKVSSELEKACDEAFNRFSMASSVMTATSEPQERYHSTPATSIGVHETSRMPLDGTESAPDRRKPTESSLQDRPLPMPPSYEEFGSFTYRELAKTRAILKKRAADASISMSPGYFDDVIAHLDRLMQPSTARIHEVDQRATSAPIEHSDSQQSKEEFEKILARGPFGLRSISNPITKGHSTSDRHSGRVTVRAVGNQKPISPTKPLTIRKKSGSSTKPSTEATVAQTSEPSLYHNGNNKSHERLQGERRSAGLSVLESSLEPIKEDEDKENRDPRGSKAYSVEFKKRSWFRRHDSAQRSRDDDVPPQIPPKDDSMPQDHQNAGFKNDYGTSKRASSAPSDESRGSDSKKQSSGRGIFFKIFSKRDSRNSKSSAERASGGTLGSRSGFKG